MDSRSLAQKDFERDTASWGLDFSKLADGSYEDFQTGLVFGSYWLGWVAGYDYNKIN